MKVLRTICLICLLAHVSMGSAQYTGLENQHNMRISVGTPSYYLGAVMGECHDCYSPYINNLGFYTSKKTITPNVNFGYSYQFKRWMAFGATIRYMGQFEYQNNHYDGSVSQKNSYTVISLIPTVRFDWFNRRYVRLYSSIGVGFTSIFISKNNYNYNYKNHYYIPWIAYDFTGIGCAFGNRVYGFAEFGFSSGGFARVGLGWRVPNKD